jgi:hypothetical protein
MSLRLLQRETKELHLLLRRQNWRAESGSNQPPGHKERSQQIEK